jgi:hypothetical protein
MQGRPAPTPDYLRAAETTASYGGCSRRCVTRSRGWTFAFVVALTWWAAALGGLSYWFRSRFIPYDPDDNVTVASFGRAG